MRSGLTAALAAQHPATVIVHVTIPLVRPPRGEIERGSLRRPACQAAAAVPSVESLFGSKKTLPGLSIESVM